MMEKNAYVHGAFRFRARNGQIPSGKSVFLPRVSAHVRWLPFSVCTVLAAASNADRTGTGSCWVLQILDPSIERKSHLSRRFLSTSVIRLIKSEANIN